jgi:1,4-alpha-glucan branching enzyme
MLRKSENQKIYSVTNFTPIPNQEFRLGVQDLGKYQVILNTDDKKYWGSGYKIAKSITAESVDWNNQEQSIKFNLPPLSSVFIVYKG